MRMILIIHESVIRPGSMYERRSDVVIIIVRTLNVERVTLRRKCDPICPDPA